MNMTKLTKSLFAGFALLGGLALAHVAAAQPVPHGDVGARTVLLAAHPELRDPDWVETVLLAAPLPNGGHAGVIINRPTSTTLGELFPGHASSQKIVDPVHYGGPVSTNAVVALVESAASPGTGSLALSAELFLAIAGRTVDRVIEQTPQAARYFVGLVVWQPGELEMELAKGLWSVHGADLRTVFRKDTKGLWHELSRPVLGLRAA
jgi:putative transcriptional regulator